MANRFYSGNFGSTMKTEITETSVTTAGASVELRVTYDATNANKQSLLMAIRAIEQKIIEDTFPPV